MRKGTRGKINRKTARFGKLRAKGRDDWKKGMVKEKERREKKSLKNGQTQRESKIIKKRRDLVQKEYKKQRNRPQKSPPQPPSPPLEPENT